MRPLFLLLLLIPSWCMADFRTIISQNQIRQQQTPFVYELLQNLAGIQVAQSALGDKMAAIFLRGAEPQDTMILYDGVQLSSGFFDFNTLLTTNIERIEVQRGSQSARFGSGAAAGAINLVSRNAGELFSARYEHGSDSTTRRAFRGGIGSERNNFAVEYDRVATEGEAENDDFKNRTIALNFHVQIFEPTNFGFIYRTIDTERGIPVSFGRLSPNRRHVRDLTLVHFPVTHTINDRWTAEAHFSAVEENFHFQDPDDSEQFFFQNTKARTSTFRTQQNFRLSELQSFEAGYEFEVLEVSEESPLTEFPETDIENHALYATYRNQWNQQFHVEILARYDHNELFGSDVSPSIRIVGEITPHLHLTGSAGLGFRLPAISEQLGPFGNAALAKHEARTFDIGLEYSQDQWKLSGLFFLNDFQDFIGFDPTGKQFDNFDDVRTSGVELQTELEPFPLLQFRATYTFLDTEAPQDLLPRAKHSGTLNVTYRWKKIAANLNWIVSDADIYEVETGDSSQRNLALFLSYDFRDAIQFYTRTDDRRFHFGVKVNY